MRIIGITGGVGAGKSRILCYLEEEYAAAICQLDQVARQLQQRGQICFEKIVDSFGTGILNSDGELDRKKLGDIVFSNEEKLAVLNAIVHPEVKLWVHRDISRKEQEGTRLYVIESAILPDAGYEDVCREMWYVHAEESIRRRRLKEAREYTQEQTTRMMKAQPCEQRFVQKCSAVIDNSGTFENTKRQIGELL